MRQGIKQFTVGPSGVYVPSRVQTGGPQIGQQARPKKQA